MVRPRTQKAHDGSRGNEVVRPVRAPGLQDTCREPAERSGAPCTDLTVDRALGVAPIGNRLYRGLAIRQSYLFSRALGVVAWPAECHSAIQPIANRRYSQSTVQGEFLNQYQKARRSAILWLRLCRSTFHCGYYRRYRRWTARGDAPTGRSWGLAGAAPYLGPGSRGCLPSHGGRTARKDALPGQAGRLAGAPPRSPQ